MEICFKISQNMKPTAPRSYGVIRTATFLVAIKPVISNFLQRIQAKALHLNALWRGWNYDFKELFCSFLNIILTRLSTFQTS